MIPAIQTAVASAAQAALPSAAAHPAADPFAGVMQQAMSSISALETDASRKVHGLLQGDGVDVHSAMIATERADMAFELTLAVRNKAVAAYQQLNSMQF